MVPPRLSGPPDRFLELEPVGYAIRTYDNDYDANWLTIRISAADPSRRWSAQESAFLTWELRILSRWLRSIADASETTEEVFTGIEPYLQLKREGLGTNARIRASLWQEFMPPGMDPTDDPYEIEFTPAVRDLLSFADSIERSVDRFPIRVVESDGPAEHYLHELGGN